MKARTTNFISILLTLGSAAALTTPTRRQTCDVLDVNVEVCSLPPPEEPTSFIALGVGTQNYTCSSAGNYTSAGASATIIDISCTYADHEWHSIARTAYEYWTLAPDSVSPSDMMEVLHPDFGDLVSLGHHYFVTNPVNSSAGISPKWDFTSYFDDSSAFVVAARTGDIPAPDDPSDNVDWLQMKGMGGQGNLAHSIYRTHTQGGQPPVKCSSGSEPITVKYTALYWLAGGEFQDA
ncbi:hypothetical protein V5O48_010689 [Marasmius crinis-equi]|uniref:Malate dehydrogenase n=1 Tax=Marasmius crinis-equi TaxID=585013 RepID=A0ABR3F7N1_9AGAR